MEKSVTTCEESVSKNHEEPRRQAESQPQENEEHEEVKEEDHEEKIPEGDKTLEHQDNALAISTDGELNKKAADAAADAASETTETMEEKQEGLGGVVTHDAEVSTEIPTDIKEEDNVNDENSNVEAIEATEEKETSKVFEEINDQVAKYEERAEKSCEDTNRENQAEENLNKVENIAEETNTDANNEETKKDAAEANLIEEQTQRDDSNGLKSTEAEGEHEEKDTKKINPTNTDDGEGSEARQKDKNEAVESNEVTDKDENEQILAAGLKESQEINEATTEDAEESEVRQKEADDASKNVEEKIVTAKNEEGEEINAEKNKDVMDQTEEEKINTDEIEEREETSKKDESKAEIRDRDGDEEVNIQSVESEETNKANTDNIEEKYENENEDVMGKAEEEKVITNEAEEREETSRKDENEAEAGQDFRERAEEEKMEAEEDEETNKVNTDNVEEIEEKDTNKKKDVMDEAEEVLVTNETEEREETTEKDNEDEECKDFRERNDNEEREDDVGEETNKANTYNVEDSEARDKNKNRVVTVEDEEEATNETEERGDASKDVRGTHVEEKLEAKEGVEENEEKNKNTDVEDKAEEEKMAEEIEETSKINSEELEKMSEQHLENVEVMSMTEEIHKAPMKDKNKRSEVDAENGETSTRGEDNQDEPNKSDGETSEHLEEERKDKSAEVKKNYEESGDTHKLEGDGKEVVTNDRFELALVELIEDFKSDDLNSNGQDGKAEKTNNHPKTDYSTGGYDQNSAAEATDLNKTADKLHSEDNLPSTKKVASTEKSRWTVEASKGSAEGASVLLQPQSIKDQPTNSRHGESPEVLARASSAELVTKWLTMHQASKFFETYVDPLEDLTESEVGVSMEARKSSETLIREAVDSDEVKFKSKTKGDAQSQCERIHLKDDEPCEKVTNVEVEDKVQVLIPNTDSELTATDAKAKLSENQGFLSDDTVESTDGNIADTFQNKVESMSGTKPSSVMEKETEATNHSPKTENDDDKHEWKPADDDQTTPDRRAHKECQEVTSEVSQEEHASVKAKPTNENMRLINDIMSEDRLSMLSVDRMSFGRSSYSLLATAKTESGH